MLLHLILLNLFGSPVKAMAWCGFLGTLWALWGSWFALSLIPFRTAITLNGCHWHGPVDVMIGKILVWQLQQGFFWVEYRVWLWFNSSLFFGV